MHLWTYRNAARARRFHEMTGFTPTGRTRNTGPTGGPPTVEIEYARPTAP